MQLGAWPDPPVYTARDLDRLAAASREVDCVVVTHKDAVKLAGSLPPIGVPVLVAHLGLVWRAGGELLPRRLAGLLTGYSGPAMYSLPHADHITA